MQIIFAIVHIIILAAFSYWLWKREFSSLKIYFWPALIVKVLAGIALGLLYTYYYSVGDTFQYFEDGTRLAALAHDDLKTYFTFLWSGNESFDIWKTIVLKEPRALFLIKIVSLLSLITLNNYWVISIYFSMASFYGAWLLAKQIVVLNQSYRNAVIGAFLFFPSVVFWSSGLIKESLAMACLFFLSSLFIKTWIKEKLTILEWVFLMFTLWMLWNLKYYYLAVFLPIVFTSLIVKTFLLSILNSKRIFVRLLVWLVVLIVPVVAISFVRPNFYPERFLHVIVSSNQAFLERSDPDDAIHYYNLQPTVLSALMNSPWALFSGLFRPFVWESHSVFQLLVAIENACIFLLTLAALFRWKTLLQSSHRLLVFSIVSYTILLCIFLTLSTPNFGTLARYKIGFMPFFLLVILIDNPILSRISSFYQRSISNLVR
ncbi:MAG: hypothetical protein ABI663_07555 [Chryseolinea sp.]